MTKAADAFDAGSFMRNDVDLPDPMFLIMYLAGSVHEGSLAIPAEGVGPKTESQIFYRGNLGRQFHVYVAVPRSVATSILIISPHSGLLTASIACPTCNFIGSKGRIVISPSGPWLVPRGSEAC